jgi:hypothetical protein
MYVVRETFPLDFAKFFSFLLETWLNILGYGHKRSGVTFKISQGKMLSRNSFIQYKNEETTVKLAISVNLTCLLKARKTTMSEKYL